VSSIIIVFQAKTASSIIIVFQAKTAWSTIMVFQAKTASSIIIVYQVLIRCHNAGPTLAVRSCDKRFIMMP